MSLKYIVTDSQNIPLASALLESDLDARVWSLHVLEGAAHVVADHQVIRLLGMEEGSPAKAARVLEQKGDVVLLEPQQSLGSEVRENLRVLAQDDTFIYPISGSWTGRRNAQVHDLSCRGVAFFCAEELARDEVLEIVLPLVEPPLILQAQVLRTRPSTQETPLYAAKFIHFIEDEEAAICEVVFAQQLRNRKLSRK